MGQKISEMPGISEVKDGCLFETSDVNSGVYSSKKATAKQIKDYINKNNNGSIRGIWSGSSMDSMTNEDAGVWYVYGINDTQLGLCTGVVELFVYKNSSTEDGNSSDSGSGTSLYLNQGSNGDPDSFWIQRFSTSSTNANDVGNVFQRSYVAGSWTLWRELSNVNSCRIQTGVAEASGEIDFSMIFTNAPAVVVTPIYHANVSTNPYMCFAQVSDVTVDGFRLQGFYSSIQIATSTGVEEVTEETDGDTKTTTTVSHTHTTYEAEVVPQWHEVTGAEGEPDVSFYWIAVEQP